MSRLLGSLHVALLAGGLSAAHADDAAVKPEDDKRWSWDAGYKADLLNSATTGTVWVGNLNLRANADAEALFGWSGTTLHTEALLNHGAKPNRRIGSIQGVSNLEVADSAARLYATWVQKEFDNGSSVLFGLYDLNSEFYATDAAGLLIHPSFGIGIDFSQSGRNGPSIFPNLGLALRAKVQHGGGHYSQVALIDGVPGDPDHVGRTVIRLSRKDGALLVGEYGWQESQAGAAEDAKVGHWSVGAWTYTQRSERVDGTGRERNHGVYALAQTVLRGGPDARTTGFARAGLANRRVNAIDRAIDFGVLVDRPFGDAGPRAVTAGVALARFGRPHRDAAPSQVAAHETAFEVGARWQPWPALAVQPLLQRTWNVGGRPGAHATVVGARIEWSPGAANP
jgi:porin